MCWTLDSKSFCDIPFEQLQTNFGPNCVLGHTYKYARASTMRNSLAAHRPDNKARHLFDEMPHWKSVNEKSNTHHQSERARKLLQRCGGAWLYFLLWFPTQNRPCITRYATPHSELLFNQQLKFDFVSRENYIESQIIGRRDLAHLRFGNHLPHNQR